MDAAALGATVAVSVTLKVRSMTVDEEDPEDSPVTLKARALEEDPEDSAVPSALNWIYSKNKKILLI